MYDFLQRKNADEESGKIQNYEDNNAKPGTGKVSTLFIRSSFEAIEKIRKRFIAIDFETTGLKAYSDRIVEIGAVIFENGVAKSSFNTLVNPGIPISAAATSVNHITNEMVKDAPNEQAAIDELVNFAKDAIEGNCYFCAHNARFDSGFLAEALRRCGYDAVLQFADTLNISRRAVMGLTDYRQETVAKHFGIENKDAHRAASDAEVCGQIMVRLCDIEEKRLPVIRKDYK